MAFLGRDDQNDWWKNVIYPPSHEFLEGPLHHLVRIEEDESVTIQNPPAGYYWCSQIKLAPTAVLFIFEPIDEKTKIECFLWSE